MALTRTLQQAADQVLHTLGPAGTLALALFLLLYAGIVLPTVWSRDAARRTAARATATTLLDHLTRIARALRALLPW